MAIQRYLVVTPSHDLPLPEHSRARLHTCSEEALALREASGSLLILISCWSNLWNPPLMAKHIVLADKNIEQADRIPSSLFALAIPANGASSSTPHEASGVSFFCTKDETSTIFYLFPVLPTANHGTCVS